LIFMPYTILLLLLTQEGELASLFLLMYLFFLQKNKFDLHAVYHPTTLAYARRRTGILIPIHVFIFSKRKN
ncbi:hypothetical protein, partial [Enterococcus viikkiensis]